jgi:hypothetical protein
VEGADVAERPFGVEDPLKVVILLANTTMDPCGSPSSRIGSPTALPIVISSPISALAACNSAANFSAALVEAKSRSADHAALAVPQSDPVVRSSS